MTSLGYACFQLHNALVRTGASRTITHNTVRDFHYMMAHNYQPHQYWEYLSNGSFKEVYSAAAAPFVLKFVSQYNETDEERSLLEVAAQEGVAQFFVPTTFIDLPHTLEAYYLEGVEAYDEEYEEEEEYVPHPLVTLQVQPRVVVNTDGGYIREADRPLIHLHDKNGQPLEEWTQRSLLYYFSSRVWLEDLAAYYTNKEICRLVDFLEAYEVCDLHNYNLGYYHGAPVIFDCFSRSLT